jgi:hypothetical protein
VIKDIDKQKMSKHERQRLGVGTNRRLVRLTTSSNGDRNATTTKKPMFQKQHYNAIVELLGQKIMYSVIDDEDYRMIEAFSEMFAQDNPTTFDKVRFRDAVYDAHSRKKKEDSSRSPSH